MKSICNYLHRSDQRPGKLAGIVLVAAAVLLALSSMGVYAAGNTKVTICHIPPGDPGNYHTITISEKAFAAHLAHGDVAGACDSACAALCDDGNACTIDDTGDCEQQGCPVTRESVDCNDGNACTADSCDAVDGCVNTPLVGESCDDGKTCSGPDICDANGECAGAALDDCCLSDDDCSQDLCDRASCDLDTNVCSNDPVVCLPPDLCSVSECASDTGECVDTTIACPAGETCNVSTGECEAVGPVEYQVQPFQIVLVDGLVSELQVLVAPEWLETDEVSLRITITGINDGFHEHGFQEMLVSAIPIIFIDPGTDALIGVEWTTDTNLTHSPETYTACVLSMVNGQPFGVENCTSFGPF